MFVAVGVRMDGACGAIVFSGGKGSRVSFANIRAVPNGAGHGQS